MCHCIVLIYEIFNCFIFTVSAEICTSHLEVHPFKIGLIIPLKARISQSCQPMREDDEGQLYAIFESLCNITNA
jgi:hypothetical protein